MSANKVQILSLLALTIIAIFASYQLFQKKTSFLSDTTVSEDQEFSLWQQKFNKFYGSEQETQARKAIFLANLRRIHELKSSKLSYTVGLNQFSDLTFAEFSCKLNFLVKIPRITTS